MGVRELLGASRVITDQAILKASYGRCTTSLDRQILGAAHINCRSEIVKILQLAAEHGIAVYPISTGNNWGYGSALPTAENCLILDLSGMNRIISVDQELGSVTLEPGVTQQDLSDYFKKHNISLLVPTHGGGQQCSIVGNALERGYGLTPLTDHFLAVTNIEAVLANGEIYRGSLSELGGAEIDKLFKWGIGPYLDGIFTQSAFGVVTQMTFKMALRPDSVVAFFCWIKEESLLEQSVAIVRDTLSSYPGICHAVNLMNAHRILAMFSGAKSYKETAISEEMIAQECKRYRVPAWMAFGGIYGKKSVVRAAAREIKRAFGTVSSRRVFIDQNQNQVLQNILAILPFKPKLIVEIATKINEAFLILDGGPTQAALPLAYLKVPHKLTENRLLNPAKDGCGLLWYAPLVPMQAEVVRKYVSMVAAVCKKHQFHPFITLTAISNACADSTVPLVFDKQDLLQKERAQACFEELFAEGQKLGVLPYRVGVNQMSKITRENAVFWKVVKDIKTVLDPKGILSPGRYTPSP